MNILIAPNSFKHSLTATDAAEAVEDGLKRSALKCNCKCFPIGDGGDGTANLIIKNCKGTMISAEVHDPLGRKITASFGLIDNGTTAVVEMANASGISLLAGNEYDPIHASSSGTGELIKLALDRRVKKIIISMGGTATVDGGTGILKALGIRFENAKGRELEALPAKLQELERIDLSGLDPRILHCKIIILCDVENTLLGPIGAATVFGPQKGASLKDIAKLEASLKRLRDVAFDQTGKDMATILRGGTAGGAAAGLYAFLNAELVNGIDYYLSLTKFNEALRKADLVITGEGSIDDQTILGKGPFGVACQAKAMGVPVIGVAGKVPVIENLELSQYFNALLSIGNEPASIEEAFSSTNENLRRTGKLIGDLLSLGKTVNNNH